MNEKFRQLSKIQLQAKLWSKFPGSKLSKNIPSSIEQLADRITDFYERGSK